MKFVSKSMMVAAATLFFSATAYAGVAQIDNAHGKVLINQGKGFVPVTGLMSLNAGDKIMVGEESFATVSYGQCAVSLSSPTVFSVSAKAPCIAGAEMTSVDGAFVVPTADVPSDYSAAPAAGVALLPLLLLGGAAAAVGVLVVTDVLDESDDPLTADAPVM